MVGGLPHVWTQSTKKLYMFKVEYPDFRVRPETIKFSANEKRLFCYAWKIPGIFTIMCMIQVGIVPVKNIYIVHRS